MKKVSEGAGVTVRMTVLAPIIITRYGRGLER